MTIKRRVLLFSYAFPPIQVQMSPAVVKPMAAFARYGFHVDVLCAEPFSVFLRSDHSLLSYVKEHFDTVTRLSPSEGLISKLRRYSRILSLVPDLMTVLQKTAFETLMDMDLERYEAVVTWSPFHSINPVMVRLKKCRPRVRWVAQFSDPWAGNPLEWSRLTKVWNWWHEPNTVRAADYIVHSSSYSRDLMMSRHPAALMKKTGVIAHPFEQELYPARPKTENERITMRYVGVLFGRRSPEPLFNALDRLFERRPKLRSELLIELVGPVPSEMLRTPAAQNLPTGILKHVPSVSYVESLEKMYDADILLLIDADTDHNLFVPSKLSDYMGASTPIVGIVPQGGSEDILKALKCWHARPDDIKGISHALESAIDYVRTESRSPWCDEDYRQKFNSEAVAAHFINIIDTVNQK